MDLRKELTELIEKIQPISIYSNLQLKSNEDDHYAITGEGANSVARSYHIFYYPDEHTYLSFPPEFKTKNFTEVIPQVILWAIGKK